MDNRDAMAYALLLCLSGRGLPDRSLFSQSRFRGEVESWVLRITSNTGEKKAEVMAWIASRVIELEVRWARRN